MRRRYPPRGRVEEPYKVNGKITAHEVRVVGENVQVGVYPISKAIEMAREQSLDLVEISPKAVPPVCKVIDYSQLGLKYKFYICEVRSG